MAARFTEAETRRQPKCPVIEDRIQTMPSVHTMEYHSAMRKDEVLPFAEMWAHLENSALSEIRQSERATQMWDIKLKFVGTDSSEWVLDGRGWGWRGLIHGERRWLDLGWGTHGATYRSCIIDMYTQNLYDPII